MAAHEVRRRTGFNVEFGPVRARDLPEYLKTHTATAEMRRVRFDLADRAVLIPVELAQMILPMMVGAAAVFLLGGLSAALAAVVAVLAGVVLFPMLLPWLPARDFAAKGLILGVAAALPFAVDGPGPRRRPASLAPGLPGAPAALRDAAGHRLPGPQLHRLIDLHFQDRGQARDVPLHPGDGGRGRRWHRARRCLLSLERT